MAFLAESRVHVELRGSSFYLCYLLMKLNSLVDAPVDYAVLYFFDAFGPELPFH